MPTGYLVSLGGNNALNSGDVISGGTVTFTTQTALGAGQWIWSGTAGGTTYTNTTEPGQYYLGTDGSVYFVPSYGPVDTLSSSSVVSSPTFAPIMGTSGNDAALSGTAGNDTIYGGASTSATGTGNDSISGAAGNDVIFAGDGNDTLQGGAGADTLYGGAGSDTASYSASGSAVNVNLGTGAASGGDATGDVLNSIENVIGSAFNDTLTGSSAANQIFGGAGADSIAAGDGDDTVDGGDGNDTIDAGAGNDSVTGGLGNDSILAGDGADTVSGGGGNDVIYGGGGADSLLGDAGNDTIYGGAPPVAATQEHVSWIGQGSNGTNLAGGFTQDTGGMNVSASFVNNGGNTAVQTSNSTQYVAGGEPYSTTSGLYLTGNAGPDVTATLTFNAEAGSGLTNQVSGLSFRINDVDMAGWQDIITINAFDINGNPVSVTLTPAGNDTVSGNTITAGNSSDTQNSAQGSVLVTVAGPLHSIQIIYSNGGTSSQALWVTDVYYTTVPDMSGTSDAGDVIDGGDGADLIAAGNGDDTIRLTGVFGNDTISGGETGETAGDLIDSTAITANETLAFSANEAGTLTDGTSTASFSQIERFQLGSGNDTVNASATTQGVNVDAGGGNDSMLGGSGADTLSGGVGNDTIQGGAGADSLSGGSGTDTVSYANSGAGVNVNLATGTGSGGDAAGDTISGFENITGSAFNDTLTGDAGANLIDAGGGADAVFGGGGNDTLYGGAGNDTLNGGAGADSMLGGLGSDLFTGLGIGDVVDGSEDPDNSDIDVLDLFGSGWTKATTNILYAGGNNEAGTVQFLDGSGNVIGTMSFSNIETVVPCFTPGTLIDTVRGSLPVETLQPGDMVLTRDSGYRPLRWVGRRDLGAAELATTPAFRPVLIRRDALGPREPARDMRVSPQHRFLLTGSGAELVSGENEVLVAALHLVGQPGIERVTPDAGVSYIHILFDEHEIVRSDGSWSESFQPGVATISAIEEAQRAELLALFPELATPGGAATYPAARMSLKAHEARAAFSN